MRRKNLLWISLVALLVTSAVMVSTVMSPAATLVYVHPAKTEGILPGGSFTVDVMIDIETPTVYGWEFTLEFDPGILQVASHIETAVDIADRTGNGTQTTFQTDEWPVVPGSEYVYVNLTLMTKPADYTIDYPTGTITFTTAPGDGADISVIYEFAVTVPNVTNGGFLEEVPWPYGTHWGKGIVAPSVNNMNGSVSVGNAFYPTGAGDLPTEGASGIEKVLATIEFNVIGYGVCPLHPMNVELDTVVGYPPHQTIVEIDPNAYTVEDGVFDNRPYNLPPNALFDVVHPGMVVPVVGLPITFDASASYDNGTDVSPPGWIASYFWDFGDGTNATGMIVDHTFTEVGAYTVTLIVTDNDGENGTATTTVDVVEWMEGGEFPDLVGECAWPERERWNEVNRGKELRLFGLVGNPTEDNFEVYVEFTIYSTEEARKLGILTTETVTIVGGETLELNVTMDLSDARWRVAPTQAPFWAPKFLNWAKYAAFARCYYRPLGDGDFEKALVAKDFSYRVHPAKADIALLGVTTNATNGVPQGNLLEIYVNMTNECVGKYPVTFNITVTYKGLTIPETEVEVRSIDLYGVEPVIETFTLDTNELLPGPYVIKATLSPLTYERDTSDNKGSCGVEII